MEENEKLSEGAVFDSAASYYDSFRPSYPPELIMEIECAAKLCVGSQILEIGSGSGKATELFIGKGYQILCIEPGPALVHEGERRFPLGSGIRFVNNYFENWLPDENRFNLIMSAHAFHWVRQPEGYSKCHDLLKHDGILALFWNFSPLSDDPLDIKLNKILLECGFLGSQPESVLDPKIRTQVNEISKYGLFGEPIVTKYQWSIDYDIHSFFGLHTTYSEFITLRPEEKSTILNKMRLIFREHGGILRRKWISTLYICKPKHFN